ncbi:MAG: phosphotransferase family protein [Deltaproteobacteria bacterium]|nr:phosphotransferase family protein [Deltaproteobacteria bacterium]
MQQIDSPKEVRDGEELDTEKIAAYLKANLKEMDGEINIKQFPSGFSNLTYMVTVGERELVLRRPPFGTKAKSAHDMKREFNILSSIKGSFDYVPEMLLYCDDEEVIGAPFYVMERLKGIILRKELPNGLFTDESGIKSLCRNWVGVLCNLHKLDYESCGLKDLGKPEGYVKRQVEGWTKRYRNARTEDVPDFEGIMEWLKDNMPEDSKTPALIHNDYKFDNVFLNPDNPSQITGVVDWEMATIGDPLMDLGASLAYWVNHDDNDEMKLIATLPTTSPGMLNRAEIVKLYEELSGTKIKNFEFYYCFGLFRLAVIAQQIYYRYYHGQTKDKRFANIAFFVHILERTASEVMLKRQF